MGTIQPAHVEREDSTHVTIVDDRNSSVCDSSASRPSDSGHERLLHKQPSSDGRSIPHCRASKPPNYLGFAILVTPFNPLFGSIAIVFSLLSLISSRNGDLKSAKQEGNLSKWLSIIGIAVTSVVLAFVIVYFAYIDKNIVDTPEELGFLDQSVNNGTAV